MTFGHHVPAGGLARRSALFWAVAAVFFAAPAGAATPPAIVLSPGNGTPGSVVTVHGSGFCGTAGCSAVSVLFAGYPAASGIAVAKDGTFRGTFRVPGGGVVGAQNVTATQTQADGYEIRAFATFDLVFGKGEDAEIQAKINDLIANPTASTLPEGPPRGVPFASFLATPGASAQDEPEVSAVRAAVRTAADRWPFVLGAGVLLGAAATVLVRRARRHRPRHAAN